MNTVSKLNFQKRIKKLFLFNFKEMESSNMKSKNSTANSFAIFQSKDKETSKYIKCLIFHIILNVFFLIKFNQRSSNTESAISTNNCKPSTIKDNLLKWCQIKTEKYPVKKLV